MKNDILDTVAWWKRAKVRAGLFIIIGIVIGINIGVGFFVWSKTKPKHIDHDVKDKSLVVVDGTRLNIFYTFRTERECQLNTTRYLWTYYELNGENIKVYLFLNNSPSSIGALTGDSKYIVSFQLPEGIWSGEWNYFSTTNDDCSFLKSLFRQQIIETYNFKFDIKNNIQKPDDDDIIKLITPKL